MLIVGWYFASRTSRGNHLCSTRSTLGKRAQKVSSAPIFLTPSVITAKGQSKFKFNGLHVPRTGKSDFTREFSRIGKYFLEGGDCSMISYGQRGVGKSKFLWDFEEGKAIELCEKIIDSDINETSVYELSVLQVINDEVSSQRRTNPRSLIFLRALRTKRERIRTKKMTRREARGGKLLSSIGTQTSPIKLRIVPPSSIKRRGAPNMPNTLPTSPRLLQ